MKDWLKVHKFWILCITTTIRKLEVEILPGGRKFEVGRLKYYLEVGQGHVAGSRLLPAVATLQWSPIVKVKIPAKDQT